MDRFLVLLIDLLFIRIMLDSVNVDHVLSKLYDWCHFLSCSSSAWRSPWPCTSRSTERGRSTVPEGKDLNNKKKKCSSPKTFIVHFACNFRTLLRSIDLCVYTVNSVRFYNVYLQTHFWVIIVRSGWKQMLKRDFEADLSARRVQQV